jgi:hypothetical protein
MEVLFVLSLIAGIQAHTTIPYHWLRWGNLMNSLPGLASNSNPPDLCLLRITGLSHCGWPSISFEDFLPFTNE